MGTPILLCASRGYTKIARLLIAREHEHGADANYAGKFTGRTLLHYLAAQGDLERGKMLIQDHRAETQPVDQDNKTPLDYAKERGHQQVVDYLEFAIPDNGGCACTVM